VSGAFLMKQARLLLVFLAAPLALFAAGCGGSGNSVPSDAVAVVDGTPISQSQFQSMVDANKTQLKAQKQAVPKPGTPEYTALRARILDFLVQQAEFEAKAKSSLGIDITDKQIEQRLTQIKKQYFAGSQARYLAQIKKQGLTDEQVHASVKSQLLSEAIFKKVTGATTVSAAAIAAYYNAHLASYKQAEKRQVRHILVKTKAQADSIEQQLKNGADFAALAKKYSTDPSSKPLGGRLPGGIQRGQTVAPFDKVAFTLKTNAISPPVHTQFGWHIIQPLSAITPATTTPLKQVQESIRQQLLQQKKNDAMTAWVDQVKKQYAGKIKYAVGYAPATTSATATAAVTTG
jgi:parvulin-like peptidyl-prolyl isomerase